MGQYYTDESRAHLPYSLPDISVDWLQVLEVTCSCGVYEVPYIETLGECPSCESSDFEQMPGNWSRWFYWYGQPGCMPDSGPYGPFRLESEAIEDARENAGF